jgi:transposase
MRRTEVLQGVRMLRFRDVFSRWEASELSGLEAAELLGVGERTFRRWRVRFEEEGEAGLCDRRLGKASGKRVPADRAEEVAALYRTRYAGFTAKHFHEHLAARHGFRWSYSWTKTFLQARGLVERAKRRGAHRRKRPRRPLPGMLLHQDGSRYAWLIGQPERDLIVTLDDATSGLYSAFLVDEEGTASSLRALMEVFCAHGLPAALYTDRGSHYFHTPEAGGKVSKTTLTQVGRALEQLGIEHIPAYSPEARGRSERAFGTLQDRLPKELALAGITTVAAANRYLAEVYIPAHNARFAVAPEQEGTAFVPVSGVDLAEILCVQEERKVGRDNTVAFEGKRLQIPESPLRPHYVGATVKVRRYLDGSHALFHGPRCIARFDATGACLAAPTRASLAACSPASRDGLSGRRQDQPSCGRPLLTPAARAARSNERAGTEKRAIEPNRETKQKTRKAA